MTKLEFSRVMGYVSLVLGFVNAVMAGYAHRLLWKFTNTVNYDYEFVIKYLNLYHYIYRYFLPLSVLLTVILVVIKITRTKVSIVGFGLNLLTLCWIYYILNPM